MLKNLFTFLLVLLFAFSSILHAQSGYESKLIKKFNQDPEIAPLSLRAKLHKKQLNQNKVNLSSSRVLKFDKVAGLIDTFSYRKWFGGDWTNQAAGSTSLGFGQSAQDVLVQWYKAPADLIIKAVGIGCATNDNNQPASVKIIRIINYTEEDFLGLINNNPTTLSARLGYYPGDDDYNDIAPFENDATGGATGNWVGGNNLPEPFGEDYWSELGLGFGVTITPTAQQYENNHYDWVEMSTLGSEPTVLRGEIFGIAVSNTGNHPSTETSGNRQSFWAQGITDNLSNIYPLLKFYEYERTAEAGDFGWWIRPLSLDFVAVVDIFGDEPPQFVEVTSLPITLSTEARQVDATITDRNPGGGTAGVQSATLHYSVDGGAFWTIIPMTNTGGDVWSGSIPGQSPGTIVDYYVEAVDVGSNANQSDVFEYRIYQATPGINTLIVWNGYSEVTENDRTSAQYYYFFKGFDHDSWAYGDLTPELVNNYSTIFEINFVNTGSDNREVIKNWLSTGNKNYMLGGSEWLGFITGWTDSTYAEGTFQRDVLGITADHNDIEWDGSSNLPEAPTHIFPQQGTLLGNSLFIAAGNDAVWYAPTYEYGAPNWIDGFEVVDGQTVDIKAISTLTGGTYNVGTHREFNGNKVVFFTFDPLFLDNFQDYDNPNYKWLGYTSDAPQNQAVEWFGIPTDIKQVDNNIPGKFLLKQNYPNPFNPTTSIEYGIPVAGNVTLTIYDMLGRKVTDLVNTYQQAGNFSTTWDGTNQSGAKVTSGTYFYQLRTDNGFVKTAKMVLLK